MEKFKSLQIYTGLLFLEKLQFAFRKSVQWGLFLYYNLQTSLSSLIIIIS